MLSEPPYDDAALEPPCSSRLLRLHHDERHAGHLTGLERQLAEAAMNLLRPDNVEGDRLEASWKLVDRPDAAKYFSGVRLLDLVR